MTPTETPSVEAAIASAHVEVAAIVREYWQASALDKEAPSLNAKWVLRLNAALQAIATAARQEQDCHHGYQERLEEAERERDSAEANMHHDRARVVELEAENQRLREGLEAILRHPSIADRLYPTAFSEIHDLARATLQPETAPPLR